MSCNKEEDLLCISTPRAHNKEQKLISNVDVPTREGSMLCSKEEELLRISTQRAHGKEQKLVPSIGERIVRSRHCHAPQLREHTARSKACV